jgi:Fe-S cluster biosynthesis and repair protein YggX
MAESASRIEQFKKMASDDPNNELGHFSLGRAYLDSGATSEAAESFQRCLAINPNLSKAYHLLATAFLKLGRKEEAIRQLQTGAQVAHERGDVMPKNDMLAQLSELGVAAPELKSSQAQRPAGEGEVVCQRCGKTGRKLPAPPFSNAQGKEIYEKICTDCWRAWIGMGTKVINELRLPLNDPKAQKVFDQHMMEFLNLR